MGGRSRGQTLGPSLDEMLTRAADAHQRGDLAAAERGCRQVLAVDACEPRATQILGAIRLGNGAAANVGPAPAMPA